ncbi:MAG: MGMT family protein [bacterium]|nr:MGMT family protein [bacterium]
MTESRNIELETPDINDNEVLMDALETPLGWMSFALTNKGLKASTFMYKDKAEALAVLKTKDFKGTYELVGNETRFDSLLSRWKDFFLTLFTNPGQCLDVPIDDTRWTDFGKKVYHYLRNVPPGRVVTYGELAEAVGSPGGSRAIGTLMKKNPIPPLVPCHRVIGSSDNLGGFSAAGGTQLKLSMLEREGVRLNRQRKLPF